MASSVFGWVAVANRVMLSPSRVKKVFLFNSLSFYSDDVFAKLLQCSLQKLVACIAFTRKLLIIRRIPPKFFVSYYYEFTRRIFRITPSDRFSGDRSGFSELHHQREPEFPQQSEQKGKTAVLNSFLLVIRCEEALGLGLAESDFMMLSHL